jgi:hypothetical protein
VPLPSEAVAQLNDEFTDLLRRGAIVQGKALPQERNEPEVLAAAAAYFLSTSPQLRTLPAIDRRHQSRRVRVKSGKQSE